MPQISSGWPVGSAGSVGRVSTRQFVKPSLLRATVRWDSPRLSSTLIRRRLSSPTLAAPALKTELARYGMSFAVRMGLPGYRVKSSFICWFTPMCLCCSTAGDPQPAYAATQLVHVGQREQPGQGRLRALVQVGPLRSKAVIACPGLRVPQGNAQIVLAEEPLEHLVGQVHPTRVPGDRVCRSVCFDH